MPGRRADFGWFVWVGEGIDGAEVPKGQHNANCPSMKTWTGGGAAPDTNHSSIAEHIGDVKAASGTAWRTGEFWKVGGALMQIARIPLRGARRDFWELLIMAELPSDALKRLGIVLPTPAKPVAAYVPTRRVGSLLFVSGQVPVVNGVPMHKGIVGQGVTIEQAKACARQCVLNGLAAAAAALGSIDLIVSVVKVGVFVASGPESTDHPFVGNGASDLLVEIFGEAGRHARAAVGCSSLPLGVPVEVEFVFEVR